MKRLLSIVLVLCLCAAGLCAASAGKRGGELLRGPCAAPPQCGADSSRRGGSRGCAESRDAGGFQVCGFPAGNL